MQPPVTDVYIYATLRNNLECNVFSCRPGTIHHAVLLDWLVGRYVRHLIVFSLWLLHYWPRPTVCVCIPIIQHHFKRNGLWATFHFTWRTAGTSRFPPICVTFMSGTVVFQIHKPTVFVSCSVKQEGRRAGIVTFDVELILHIQSGFLRGIWWRIGNRIRERRNRFWHRIAGLIVITQCRVDTGIPINCYQRYFGSWTFLGLPRAPIIMVWRCF